MAVRRPPIILVPVDVCAHGTRDADHLISHTTEGHGDIFSLARYFAGTPDKLCSSFAIEPTGRIGQYVRALNVRTYHVANHNTQCLGTELIGFEALHRSEWLALPRRRQVYANAWLHAYLCDQLGIPPHASGSDKTGRRFIQPRGLSQHKWVPDNDHTDCGPGYPWDVHLELATKWLRTGGPIPSTRRLIATGSRLG